MEAFFLPRMSGIGKDGDRPQEHRLDIGNRNAMLAAFVAVAVVPVEAGNLEVHWFKMSFVHTFVKPWPAST